MKYIDTHAHYGHKRFGKNHKNIINEMRKHTEIIIQIGTKTSTNKQVLKLINEYDFFYGIVGYFPTDVWELEQEYCNNALQNWDTLKQQLVNSKIVGIGEIGLDYSWDKVGDVLTGKNARELQKKWFIKQLDLAQEMKLPVSIHSRDAEKDTLEIFDMYGFIPGVIHCFSYGQEAAMKAIEKGLYLGIGGTSTYPSNNELRNVIKEVPLERLLLETDAPYLSPQPIRREINTSANIKYVIENIAELKRCSYDDVVKQTNKNAYQLFKKLAN